MYVPNALGHTLAVDLNVYSNVGLCRLLQWFQQQHRASCSERLLLLFFLKMPMLNI